MATIKGLCKRCMAGVKEKPGAAYYCSHNKAGAVYLQLDADYARWLTYFPMAEDEFLAALVAIEGAKPQVEAQVRKAKAEVSRPPATND